jgi:hypothetical protein
MKKLELSSSIDSFIWISETLRCYGFLSGFPPFDAFLIVVSMGENVFIYK